MMQREAAAKKRVLFVSVPQAGHLTPLMPLARAIIDLGGESILASGPDARDTADAHGLPFRPIGPAYEEWFGLLRSRTRGFPGDGLAPSRIEKYFLPRLFGEVGAAQVVDDLLEATRSLEPDLIVFEPVSFAAPLVGAVTGTPCINHTVGPLSDPEVLELVGDVMSPMWREFGLNVPPAAGVYQGITLTICPPSLDPASRDLPGSRSLRPVSRSADPNPPLPVQRRHPHAPLVYVTLGTFSNNLELFGLILEALEGEDLEVVATIGADKDPAELTARPRNATIEQFIPQHQLLPHCDAVIHHAGAGTTFGILAHGLPSVALPQSADNFNIADRLSQAGVSETLMPEQVNADTILGALRRVLGEPRHQALAEKLAAEIAAMPGAEEVAGSLLDDRPAS
jgi:UDP:flavonoid glycosyltransferase YjiC (YdhE family)